MSMNVAKPSPQVFNAYVDGFNLYKGVLESRPELKWLDVLEYCKSQMPDYTLGAVYYFTAPVKRRFAEDSAPERQEKYLRVLKHLGIDVVRGKFRKDAGWYRLYSKKKAETIAPEVPSFLGLTQRAIDRVWTLALPDSPKAFVWKMHEKGSDVNLASYLLRDAFRGEIAGALVITGDSDLVTPVKFAVAEGIFVQVVVPNRKQNCEALRAVASGLRQIHPVELADYLLPEIFITPKGGSIRRPQPWS
jgi:hypothetical protein